MNIKELDVQTILNADLLELVTPECRCGVTIEDGWKPIVNEAIRNIFVVLKYTDIGDIVFDQIKEKFGLLRIYYHYENLKDDVEGLRNVVTGIIRNDIRNAERVSAKTCEFTGNAGELYSVKNWVKTLSEEKALELGAIKLKQPLWV